MNDDRFAPPPAPDLPSDIVARPSPTPGAAFEDALAAPKPRRTTRYRRPLNTPLVIWIFALIGVGAVVLAFAAATRRLAIQPPDLSALTKMVEKPTQWQPVGSGEDGVLIDVRVQPRDARIFVDDQLASSNPIRLPRSQEVHKILVSAPGYQSQNFERRANEAHSLKVKLEKSKQP